MSFTPSITIPHEYLGDLYEYFADEDVYVGEDLGSLTLFISVGHDQQTTITIYLCEPTYTLYPPAILKTSKGRLITVPSGELPRLLRLLSLITEHIDPDAVSTRFLVFTEDDLVYTDDEDEDEDEDDDDGAATDAHTPESPSDVSDSTQTVLCGVDCATHNPPLDPNVGAAVDTAVESAGRLDRNRGSRWYSVTKGLSVGVFEDFDIARELTDGIPGAYGAGSLSKEVAEARYLYALRRRGCVKLLQR